MVVPGSTGRLVPDRLITASALAIVALGVLPIVLSLAQPPCQGDLPCGWGVALLLLGPPAVVYLVAIAIWVAMRRALPPTVTTTVAASFSLETLLTEYVSPEARPLYGMAFLAPFVLTGPVETLRWHRIERWLTVVLVAVVAAHLVPPRPGGARPGGARPGGARPGGARPGDPPVLDSAPHGGDREE